MEQDWPFSVLYSGPNKGPVGALMQRSKPQPNLNQISTELQPNFNQTARYFYRAYFTNGAIIPPNERSGG